MAMRRRDADGLRHEVAASSMTLGGMLEPGPPARNSSPTAR
jgi:hypothetical protein